MAHCVQGKPHIYLHHFTRCGCVAWAVRKPRKLNKTTYQALIDSRAVTRIWNRKGLLGAHLCKHHSQELEQYK